MAVRTTQPANDNKCYLSDDYGGYNKCILGNANNPYKSRPVKGSCLPNCVGYVYGRYLEYWGLKAANLPTCDAKNWYAQAKARGFKCSKTPSIGSIIVFNGTTYGHVAFVERIEENGDLFLSESNWGHEIFKNRTVKKSNNYAMSSAYPCLGFVANPNPLKTTTIKQTTTTTTKKTTTTTTKTESFFPDRGYFKKGDVSANIGKIASFMYKTFPAYTSKSALGNTYGNNLVKAIVTFQKNTGLTADGCIGPKTLEKLKKYGFSV